MSPMPIDISAINTAIVLAIGGLVVHWIRRVNHIFVEWEVMRKGWEEEMKRFHARIQDFERTLSDHETIWEDLSARMRNLEGNGRWSGR